MMINDYDGHDDDYYDDDNDDDDDDDNFDYSIDYSDHTVNNIPFRDICHTSVMLPIQTF